MTSVAEVLEAIDPVDPDQVVATNGDVFEARWSTVNRNDVDLQRLRRHPGCECMGDDFEPEGLPGWRAVRFRFQK